MKEDWGAGQCLPAVRWPLCGPRWTQQALHWPSCPSLLSTLPIHTCHFFDNSSLWNMSALEADLILSQGYTLQLHTWIILHQAALPWNFSKAGKNCEEEGGLLGIEPKALHKCSTTELQPLGHFLLKNIALPVFILHFSIDKLVLLLSA